MKRAPRNSELPDEGWFITDVPGAPFFITGRRDPTSGDLFAQQRVAVDQRVNIADLVARIKQKHGVEVEIVTGDEAERLFFRADVREMATEALERKQ
jgi:hypothetical protein